MFTLQNASSAPLYLIETRENLQPTDVSAPMSRLEPGTLSLIADGTLTVHSGSLPALELAPRMIGGLLRPQGTWDGATAYHGSSSLGDYSDLVRGKSDNNLYVAIVPLTTVGADPAATPLEWAPLVSGQVVKISTTITLAMLQALGSTLKTHAFPVGTVPQGARILGYNVGEGSFTALDDASHAAWRLRIGAAGGSDAAIMTNVSVAAGSASMPTQGTSALPYLPTPPITGADLNVIATIDTAAASISLHAMTAGLVTVNLYYQNLP